MTALDERSAAPQSLLDERGVRRHLLSWVRDPLAAQLADHDDGASPVPARGKLATGVSVNATRVAGPDVYLHGPGDVIGIDTRQVVRVEPSAGATAAEPEFLAAVDFDDPALPWRLTPLAPRESDGLLRPWLVLVVVDTAEADVRLEPRRTDRPAVLVTPGRLLPPLSESPAWAHADVLTAGAETVAEVLAEHPERAVSRLVCPTPLVSDRDYLACVVPAFAHGVAAGLGAEPTGETTGPAWRVTAAEVRLPVYHSWRFRTGSGGDFRTLAGRLRPVVPGDGRRTLAYRGADPELDAALGEDDPGTASLLPALRPAGATADPPVPPAWPLAMLAKLERGDVELTPPVHLGAHLGVPGGLPADPPPWLITLNTDPRLRAAAGIGAQVVREEQEAMMAAAWAQAADLAAANTVLRQGATARAVGDNLHRRHLAPADPVGFARSAAATGEPTMDAAATSDAESDVVLQRAAPVLDRLPAAEGTVAGALGTHGATAGAVTAATIRALRPTTALAKRAGATPAAPLLAPASRLARADLPLITTSPGDIAYSTFDSVHRISGVARPTGPAVEAAPTWWRAWAQPGAQRPLVTPGRHAFMADVVTLDPVPGQPGALRVSVARDMAHDGACRTPAPPAFTVTAPAGVTADTVLAGGVLLRGRDAQPALAVLYRRDEQVGGKWPHRRTHHLVHWLTRVTPTGCTAAPALETIGAGRWTHETPYQWDGWLSITARRVPGGPDELVVFVADPYGDSLNAIASRPDGSVTRSFARLPEEPWGRRVATAAAWLPPPSTGAETAPTDVVVAWLREATDHAGQPVWELRYCGIRDYFGGARVIGQGVWAETVAPRLAGDANLPSLDLTVTEVDGMLGAQMLVHVTHPYTAPNGQVAWQTAQVRPRVSERAFEPLPVEEPWPGEEPWQESASGGGETARVSTSDESGQAARMSTSDDPVPGIELTAAQALVQGAPRYPGVPVSGRLTRRVVGDVDETRLTRLAALADRLVVAAAAHQRRTVTPVSSTPGDVWHPAGYQVASVADEVSAALSPGENVTRRVLDRITVDGEPLPVDGALRFGDAPDPLRPRHFEPVFPQPMSEPLLTRFPELVAPGAGALPPDGIAMMTGNAELVAAYLAGVNAEFGRELLWRGFPTGGRATWFRRFFDTRGTTAGDEDGDVLPVDEWGDKPLAGVATGTAAGSGVTLLVRADLLRRFPNTVVQAVPAVRTATGREPQGAAVNPTASGVLGADIAVYTFPLRPEEMVGAAGWFFVFAEPPTQPRFGPLGGAPDWKRSGGPTAGALLRLPHRVAIHASDLIDGAIA